MVRWHVGGVAGLGDPVAYGQKTALRLLAVYRRKSLRSSTGLAPHFALRGLAAAAVRKPTVAQYTRYFSYLQAAKLAKESGHTGRLHATR
jgi:hypothetical protein